jgi:hypothetical protein
VCARGERALLAPWRTLAVTEVTLDVHALLLLLLLLLLSCCRISHTGPERLLLWRCAGHRGHHRIW